MHRDAKCAIFSLHEKKKIEIEHEMREKISFFSLSPAMEKLTVQGK